MKPTGNTILITGGGSGIGRALAQRLHDAGNTVIVAGRRLSTLGETVGDRADMHAIELDVDSAAGIADFTKRLLADYPNVNVLINNAGIMRVEDVTAPRDLADAEAIVTTNLLGPIRLIDALVAHLSAQPDAAIVNVTSGLAFVPLPLTPTYSATKAALHSYTMVLRVKLQGRIEVIEIAPPGVQTELTPGQSHRPGFMPLDAFADEAVALLTATPSPSEVIVENVRSLRTAEAEGRTDQMLAMFAAGPA